MRPEKQCGFGAPRAEEQHCSTVKDLQWQPVLKVAIGAKGFSGAVHKGPPQVDNHFFIRTVLGGRRK